ncbi:hypothetical protein ABPG72_002966 [Tetrahymena utriculariae]
MGNCQGLNLDINQIQSVNLNQIDNNVESKEFKKQDISSEEISQMLSQIRDVEDLTNSLYIEKSFLDESQTIQNQNFNIALCPFSKLPSTKLNNLDKIPEKQLFQSQESLHKADLNVLQLIKKDKKQQQILNTLKYQEDTYQEDEIGQTIYNQSYKPIKVFSRFFEDYQDPNAQFKLNSPKGYVQNNVKKVRLFQQQMQQDELFQETESDGNYEGSEEENFKTKEKLIDNIFTDRSKSSRNNQQLSVIEDAEESSEYSPIQASPKMQTKKESILKLHERNNKKIKRFKTVLIQGCRFQGQLINKQRNGIGKLTFQDGTVYIGEWILDKRHGKGVQIWPDDTLYEGEWENDFIQGMGKIEYSNRSYYIGEWKENKFHGKGRFQHFSGSYYEGFWFQDKQHGKGVEVQLYPTYSRHEGIFENGKKEGKGRISMANGSSYKGDFKDGNVHGLGVYNWPNGVVYEGRWENNKMSGNGKMTWQHNITYQGEFKNDQKSGIGCIEYEDGSKFIGEWKADKQHGNGTFYFKKNSSQIKGVWEHGKLVKIINFYMQKMNGLSLQNLNQNNINYTNLSFAPSVNLNKSLQSPKNSIDIMYDNFIYDSKIIATNKPNKNKSKQNNNQIKSSKYINIPNE